MYHTYYLFDFHFKHGGVGSAPESVLPILASIMDAPDNITSTGINATANILENIAGLETVSQEVTEAKLKII